MPQFLTLATILALAPAVLAQTQGSPTLAIAEVTARGKADADSATDMADALTEALVADGRVRVVERQQIAKVMKEQALSQAGVVSDEVQVKVAQLVGARWIVLGTLGTKGQSYVLSLRALDSSSAQVAFAGSVKVGSDEQIEAGSRQLARKLADKLLGPAAAGQAQAAASGEVVGDFDASQVKDGAKAVARTLALKFPKLTGKILNVIPNGTASCSFREAQPFKGEFFQISGTDEVTGQDTTKGYFLLSSYSQNGCSGRIKREGMANVNDGDTLVSMPLKIGVEAVEAGPGTQPELARMVSEELRAALDTLPQFQVASDPQLTATGRVSGGRGHRSVALQVIDKGGNVVGKVDVPVAF